MIRPKGMGRHSAGRFLAGFFLYLLLLPPAIFAQTPESSGQLRGLNWQGQLLGRSQTGAACWVSGPEGSVRLEVLPGLDIQTALADLLQQQGEGYTLILGTGDSGTFNAWGRQWRKVGGTASLWVRLVAGILEGEDPAKLASSGGLRLLSDAGSSTSWRPRFLASLEAGPGLNPIRVQLPHLGNLDIAAAEESSLSGTRVTFRENQVNRGTGRGGHQEILTFQKRDLPGDKGWELNSSRKPGRILLSRPEIWLTSQPGPEVFAPLWSLGQLLVVGDKIAGTSTGP